IRHLSQLAPAHEIPCAGHRFDTVRDDKAFAVATRGHLRHVSATNHIAYVPTDWNGELLFVAIEAPPAERSASCSNDQRAAIWTEQCPGVLGGVRGNSPDNVPGRHAPNRRLDVVAERDDQRLIRIEARRENGTGMFQPCDF